MNDAKKLTAERREEIFREMDVTRLASDNYSHNAFCGTFLLKL